MATKNGHKLDLAIVGCRIPKVKGAIRPMCVTRLKALSAALLLVGAWATPSDVCAADQTQTTGRYVHPAEAVDGADWPTVAHDIQRTNYTLKGPQGRLKLRWAWSNGQKITKRAKGVTGGVSPFNGIPRVQTSGRFTQLAQPMVRGGIAYIGSVDSELFAIDVRTGQTKWKSLTRGKVMHCVTVTENAVFVGTLRGVDAFDLEGKKLWTFEDKNLGQFRSCPAVTQGLVLIGSSSGYFFGLDAKTGQAKWAFDADAPIYHTPAVYKNAIYFGAEDLHAYSLDIRTGKVNWKSDKLYGLGFGPLWPVVVAKEQLVIFGTVALRGNRFGYEATGNEFDYDKAQDNFKAACIKTPSGRNHFFLNMKDGKETVWLPTGQFGNSGEIAPPPIVLADKAPALGGSVLMYHYAKEGAFQVHHKYAGWGDRSGPVMDLGIVDFKNGRFKRMGPVGSRLHAANIVRWDDFFQVSMGGTYVYAYQGGVNLGSSSITEKDAPWDFPFTHYRQPGSPKPYSTVGNASRSWLATVSCTVLPDVILVNTLRGVCIVAFEADTRGGDGKGAKARKPRAKRRNTGQTRKR